MSRGAPSGYTLAVHPAQQSTGFHDPAAAIFEDGRLRYGAEEERFTRVKHAEGTFPTRAVEACLAHCDVEMGDLDRVVVPYDYDALRTTLAVPRETLDEHGAVSEPTTLALARAARDTADATWGIATTGVAGPGGGTPDKPVGTGFVGVAYAAPWESGDSTARISRYEFDGDRTAVRERLARRALRDLETAARDRGE